VSHKVKATMMDTGNIYLESYLWMAITVVSGSDILLSLIGHNLAFVVDP
jgi:hypothetical protein